MKTNITESYLYLILVISNLILAKVLHINNFIGNAIYHGCSACNFVNFSEFLENLCAGSGYRAF